MDSMQLSYTVVVILSYSILIAGVIGIFRFSQISNKYRPFIYLIWIGCLSEILSTYFALVYHNNLAVGTIYGLCESLLLLWFFSRLGTFKNRNKVLYGLIVAFVIIWLVDNFFSSHLNVRVPFYFEIVYALTVVLLSIRTLNELLFTEKEFLKNPTFLICIGLIIFFTYQIIVKLFWLYGLKESLNFRMNVQTIMILINCFTNLIFAVAVLWMKKRRPFTLQFGKFDEPVQAIH
jgi:hypothetical protein